MRFYTVQKEDQEIPAVSVDGGVTAYALSDLGVAAADMNEVIRAADPSLFARIRAAVDEGKAQAFLVAEATLLAPIPRPRQDVICLGINYSEHAREAGMYSDAAFGGERPYTIYFSKRVNLAVAPGGDILSHQDLVDSLDYECELGVVLGEDVSGVSEEDAERTIFGYTIVNDVSARNVQTRHKQWYLGKSLDGFTPIGPCIVTPDELGDAKTLDVRCYVNGVLRQNSNTRYMIQTVAGAIAELSAGMTLQAGTIIATGTPAGVGMGMQPPAFLQPGDVVTCEISGIGVLENTVR